MTSLTELDDDTVRTMSIGAVFSDFVSLVLLRSPLSLAIDSKLEPCFFDKLLQVGKINSIDFHRKEDLLVTASEDDSVRFYDIANAKSVFSFLFLFFFLHTLTCLSKFASLCGGLMASYTNFDEILKGCLMFKGLGNEKFGSSIC